MIGAQQTWTASSTGYPKTLWLRFMSHFEYAHWLARERCVQYSHAPQLRAPRRSVLVLRTFSKVYGLAGARVGYRMGPAELINYLARLKSAFIVNSISCRSAGLTR